EEQLPNVKNIHVRAEEFEEKIVFLHKVEEGSANESYGIHVAKLAELPDPLIERASKILHKLEENNREIEEIGTAGDHLAQLSFFPEEQPSNINKQLDKHESEVISQLQKLNLLDMTPLEAMNELYQLQQKVKDKKGS